MKPPEGRSYFKDRKCFMKSTPDFIVNRSEPISSR